MEFSSLIPIVEKVCTNSSDPITIATLPVTPLDDRFFHEIHLRTHDEKYLGYDSVPGAPDGFPVDIYNGDENIKAMGGVRFASREETQTILAPMVEWL